MIAFFKNKYSDSLITNTKVFYSSKPWMWNLATVPAWPDLMHITLWRNYEFLHSFRNFSKSNALGKNLIRTKFILHKIFFWMSILLSSKTLTIFFNLHNKICEIPFVGERDRFEGRGSLATKINKTFFVENKGLNIFRFTIFWKKKNFQNNGEK